MLGKVEYFPEELTEQDHHYVGSYILRDIPGEPKPLTAACLIPPDGLVKPPARDHVTALKRQINQAVLWPDTIHIFLTRSEPAEAFVAATVESIPLHDVIRGYFKASRLPLPPLAGPFAGHLDQLTGLNHVSIITHNAEATHADVEELAKELYARGINHVSALRGRVYGSIDPQEVDVEQLSSSHAPFMEKIGSLCLWEG
jgi:hypothetical protein